MNKGFKGFKAPKNFVGKPLEMFRGFKGVKEEKG